MNYHRKDHEPPLAINEWGWRYHHIGIPVTEPIPGEDYMPKFKLYRCGFDTSPYGIEWMRYEIDSPVNELIKRIPHIAFEVDNIDMELRKHDFTILTKPNPPGDDIRVAMIEHNGAIIELIEFSDKFKSQ